MEHIPGYDAWKLASPYDDIHGDAICEYCDHPYLEEDGFEVDGMSVCPNCVDGDSDFARCDTCGEVHFTENMSEHTDGKTYCEGCYAELMAELTEKENESTKDSK